MKVEIIIQFHAKDRHTMAILKSKYPFVAVNMYIMTTLGGYSEKKADLYLSINRNICQHFITFLIPFPICSTILTFLKLPWEQTN
jgi:ABC-type uncharacterized transport system permease subunit